MLSRLNSETGWQERGSPFVPIANLTAFWVRDDFRQKWAEAGRSEYAGRLKSPLQHYHILVRHLCLAQRRILQGRTAGLEQWMLDLSPSAGIPAADFWGSSGKREENTRYIDILVVPKQTSNVEFSQFVYEYHFHGEAESIIVNTERISYAGPFGVL